MKRSPSWPKYAVRIAIWASLLLFPASVQATFEPLWQQYPTVYQSGTQSSAEATITGFPWNTAQRVADDFIADRDTSILSVTWWGASSDGMLSEIDNIDQVTAFKIEFFTTDPTTGGVGTSIYETVIAADQTNPTLTSLELLGGSDVFQHSVILDEAVELEAGERYWFSVAAYLDSDPMWNWYHGNNTNYTIDVDDGVNGVWGDSSITPGVHQDMAFVICVPEPATVLFFGLGMIGYVRSQSRRKIHSHR